MEDQPVSRSRGEAEAFEAFREVVSPISEKQLTAVRRAMTLLRKRVRLEAGQDA